MPKKFSPPTTVIDDDITDKMIVANEPPPAVKHKKELSDNQRANLKKGMEALRAKREQLRLEQEMEATTDEPKVVEKPKAPKANKAIITPTQLFQPSSHPPPVRERKPYQKKSVSFDDFNNFKNELMSSLKPTVVERPVVTEKIIEKPVERVVEKSTIKYLSGSELLDNLFFNRH